MPHHRGLFSTKAGKILFAYNQVLREGDARGQGPSLWGDGGDTSPQTFGQGGHNIFCPPNIL